MGIADIAGGEMIIDSKPLGQWGNLYEIAAVVEFITSEAASYITRVDILVDDSCKANY